jgi:hypothetical protein
MIAQPKQEGWTRAGHLLAMLFIIVFLAPNLVALVIPYEEFPYTSAPMFAHYVGEETPRYRFHFIAVFVNGQAAQEIYATDLGLNGVGFSRYFLGSMYGSIDPRSPFGHHGEDTEAAFENRLSGFFRRMMTVLARRGYPALPQVSGIRLEVARLNDKNEDAELHMVGRYDVATEWFIRTWGNEP